MTGDFSRRVMLGGMVTAMAGAAAPPARAAVQEDDVTAALERLRGMSWDGSKRNALYRSRSASVQVVDFAELFMDNREWDLPSPSLTVDEVKIVTETLEAALKWYQERALDAPVLPVLDGKFVVFFAHDLGVASGMTGEAVGVVPFLLRLVMDPYVPKGVHILYNAEHLRNYYQEHPWSQRIPIAHEIVHAIDADMRRSDGDRVGGWVGEGLTDALAQASLKSLGYDPLVALKRGARAHGKSIGLRPYDYPLALNFDAGRVPPTARPAWTRAPEQKEADTPDHASGFWRSNATYFTQSFWRFLFHEHAGRDNSAKGGKRLVDDYRLAHLFKRMQLTGEDIAKAKANLDMDAGIALLDRFIRAHHPAYMPAGLHRAFPAFVAHFVEWPDQVIGSRQGIMAHPGWINAMFMDGAPLLPISETEGIDHQIRNLRPIAARAIRFKLPFLLTSEEAYPRVTISVTALNGGPDAIDNIHVGVRGQCLANHLSQRTAGGSGRTRRWTMVDARPLMRAAVNGESILTFINCAPDACTTRPVSIRISVVLEMARANGQLFYTPMPKINRQGQEVTPPRSASPAMGKQTPTLSTTRGTEGIEIGISQDEDLSKLTQAMGHVPGTLGMFAERKTDSTAKPATPEDWVALTQQLAVPRGLSQLAIRLGFPRVEPGHRGAVAGGTARASWFEPRYPPLNISDLSGQVAMETDKVDITIVSSTEGALIGTFRADFNGSGLDPDNEFGGIVTGNFSVGIALDESQDNVMPVDTAALVNTDFFHVMSMSGMTGEQMIEALGGLRDTAAESENSGSSDSSDGGGTQGNPAGAGQGGAYDARIAGIPSPEEVEACTTGVTKLDLDRAMRHLHGDLAAQHPDIVRELRETYLADWENTKRLLCLWKVTGAVP